MRTQTERAHIFRALHERPGIFIMPNPWDAGTAKLFASLGFEALATTSLELANMLYAPGLRDLETIRQVVAAVGKPLNVVMSAADPELTAQQLASAGVKRISVGGALSRLAYAAVRDAALAMRDGGRFQWVRDTMPTQDLKAIFSR